MSIENALASVAVNDLDAALRWYEKLFGRAADTRPMAEVAEWKFPRGGWLQVYRNPERAGRGSVTLAVSGFEAQVSALRKNGIDPGEPMESGGMKVVMIKDPEGNSIAFAEAMDAGAAR